MQVNPINAVLVESNMLSPKVRHFVFELKQEPIFKYVPGQFITIHFNKEEKALKRSYSIANAPTDNNRIEFAAGYVENGPGTELLFNLKPMDCIQISGPYGRLILKEELPKRYILAATSTGVTPYRAMLGELKRRLQESNDLKVVILLGVQNQEEVLYKKEFVAFCEQFPAQVQFRAQLSRVPKHLLQANEYAGYVQHSFAELALNPENDLVYLCGNPAMIDESFEDLKNRGFALQQIIREKYISR